MKKMVLVCLIIMALTGLWMKGEQAYWQYWNFEPVIIHSEILPVKNYGTPLRPGDILKYSVDGTKTMDVVCVVKRQLINGYVIDFEAVEPPAKKLNERKTVPASLPLPKNIDAGTWRLRSTWECYVGPEKRPIRVTRESEKFEVTQ
jgi:hypothetical protein